MAAADVQNEAKEDKISETLVYTWGVGRSGELGHSTVDSSGQSVVPNLVTFKSPTSNPISIIQVSCSESITGAVSKHGLLFMWGIWYKCGLGENKNLQDPVTKPRLNNFFYNAKNANKRLFVQLLRLGESHCGALVSKSDESQKQAQPKDRLKDCDLYLWGKSENGCIGDGNGKKHNVLEPFRVPIWKYLKLDSSNSKNKKKSNMSDENINTNIYISDFELGWKTSGIILSDGSLFTWGQGGNKILGHKDISYDRLYPEKVIFPSEKPKQKGKKNKDVNSDVTSINASNITGNDTGSANQVFVAKLSLGSHHAGAVTRDGQVYTWGNNAWGNLGLGNNKVLSKHGCPNRVVFFASADVDSKEKEEKDDSNLGGSSSNSSSSSSSSSDSEIDYHIAVDISCTNNMLTPVKGPGKEGLHTLVITQSGKCYSFGAGHKGKCGNLKDKWGFHLRGVEDNFLPYHIGDIPNDGNINETKSNTEESPKGTKKENDKNVKKDDTNINTKEKIQSKSAAKIKATKYFENEIMTKCCSSALHSGVLSDNGDLYTFGCGSDGRMGLKAYGQAASGSGRQRYKFYVSPPTKVEKFIEDDVKVLGFDSSRRHMIAFGVKR